MNPDHDTFAPPSPSHAQSLAADLALFVGDAIQLTLLFLPAALDILILTGRPFLLSALVDKLGAVLLECHNSKQCELVVMVDFDRGPGHHHGREGFVALNEILLCVRRHGDEVGLEVLGVLDEERWLHNRGERFRCESAPAAETGQLAKSSWMDARYSRLSPLQSCKVRLDGVVLVEFGLDIIVDRVELLSRA